ncbi:MAG: flagellar assembly protein fliX [Rhizobiales bacterium]|nr:flagellar assembly protein fliX [Hyphomicrobiales bacterium]
MRIENTGSSARLRGVKGPARTTASGGTFGISEENEAVSSAATASPAANVGNLSALLMLQNVDDSLSGNKRTAEQGFDILDRLEELRLGLLSGRLSATQVSRIAHKIRNLGRSGDKRLDSILSDIDMRARVELAKLGIYDL